MVHIQQYQKVKSLDEAFELLMKNRMNQIIGGMMWLRLQERSIPTAIDLSDLELNKIEETKGGFLIGAMTSLHEVEKHSNLQVSFHHLLSDALKDIVGVQFRNGATLGGSIYARFGFSDVLCALLCLDVEVHLYKGGSIPLQEYVNMPYERDIITHIYIKKEMLQTAYTCVRKSATDLPVLNMAGVKSGNTLRLVVGSHPKRAMRYDLVWDADFEAVAKQMQAKVSCETNMRGSADYRSSLVYALTLRILKQLKEEGS